MATSGTTTFNLAIDDIVEEAYERCGAMSRSGYDLASARRSLNILFTEWGNRGVHLWEVKSNESNLVEGTDAYDAPAGTQAILESWYRNSSTSATNPTDTALTKIDRSAYANLANKLSKGTPSQYYVDMVGQTGSVVSPTVPQIYIYQTADSGHSSTVTPTLHKFMYYYVARLQDAGVYSNNADVVYKFIAPMCSGLAFYLSQKIAPEKTDALRLYYEDELARALKEDGERTSSFITPQAYYPSIT